MKKHFTFFAILFCAIAAFAQSTKEFYLVPAGSYTVGSPESEDWREKDETQRTVKVDAFYIGITEVTQEEYERVMKKNPSAFKSKNNPVDSVTFFDAVEYCNARSKMEDLTECYKIDGETVTWNKSADDANFYGHYPYQIEQNYFTQNKLETKPGQYRGQTVPVKSFKPNKWGLYDMHGNVTEWTIDFYGDSDYLRVVKGGGWNDFAKHMRSAYRSAVPEDDNFSSRGFRLARNVN